VDDVGGVALAQPGPEGAGPGQGAGDPSLALVPLLLVLGEQRCGLGIGGRGADQDAVDVFAPGVDGDADAGEPGQQLLRVRLGEERNGLGPVLYRDGLVVAGGSTVLSQSVVSNDAGYPYQSRAGFDFPYGDYFRMALDPAGKLHAAWGESPSYRDRGNVWVANER